MGVGILKIISRFAPASSIYLIFGLLSACLSTHSLSHSDSLKHDTVRIDVRLTGVRYQRFDHNDKTGSFVYGTMMVQNSGQQTTSFNRDDYRLYVTGLLSAKPEPRWSPAVATCAVALSPGEVVQYNVYWFFDAFVPLDDLKRSTVQFIQPESNRPPCRF